MNDAIRVTLTAGEWNGPTPSARFRFWSLGGDTAASAYADGRWFVYEPGQDAPWKTGTATARDGETPLQAAMREADAALREMGGQSAEEPEPAGAIDLSAIEALYARGKAHYEAGTLDSDDAKIISARLVSSVPALCAAVRERDQEIARMRDALAQSRKSSAAFQEAYLAGRADLAAKDATIEHWRSRLALAESEAERLSLAHGEELREVRAEVATAKRDLDDALVSIAASKNEIRAWQDTASKVADMRDAAKGKLAGVRALFDAYDADEHAEGRPSASWLVAQIREALS